MAQICESEACHRNIDVLSRLALRFQGTSGEIAAEDKQLPSADLRYVAGLEAAERSAFADLANKHHVIARAFAVLRDDAKRNGDRELAEWCEFCLNSEHLRIDQAIKTLQQVCTTLGAKGCEVAVIKSLDHLPDLGSDLDLCTTAPHAQIDRVMREEFGAMAIERSWGDRLASKWNYKIPGLPELIEIHVQYLGQIGEHQELVQKVIHRGMDKAVGSYIFRVPRAEERILISTLQRVYRHLYYRLCDMVDTATLVRSGQLDFAKLEETAQEEGIWPGVATYLCLADNYVRLFGATLELRQRVTESAYKPGSKVKLIGQYLRVSKGTAAALFATQFGQAARKGDGRAVLRLPLLPPLAVTALVAQKLTGSDKGIW